MSSLKHLPADVTNDAEPLSSNIEPQTEVKAFAREGVQSDHSVQHTQSVDQTPVISDQNSSGDIHNRTINGACPDVSGLKSQAFQLQEFLDEHNVTHKDLENYHDRLPENLRTDFYDAMIVYHDEDYAGAKSFLDKIKSEVKLSNGEKPKVDLHDNIGAETGFQLTHLDQNLQRCVYVFAYITDKFLKDSLTKFKNNACLWDSVDNCDEFKYIPVLTNCKQKKRGVLPPSIACVKSLDLWNGEKMIRDLKKLFEHAVKLRRKKEDELQFKRKIWIMEEKKKEKCEDDRRIEEVQACLRTLHCDDGDKKLNT